MNRRRFFPSILALSTLLIGCSQGGPPAAPTPEDWSRALRRIPSDWATLCIRADRLDEFTVRLPRLREWLAYADEYEKTNPRIEPELQLERLHSSTRATVLAASPHAVAFGLYFARVSAFGPVVPPNDLDSLMKNVAFLDVLQKYEPEFATVSSQPSAYRPSSVLRSGSGGMDGLWLLGGNCFIEPQVGVLVSGVSVAGVKRVAAASNAAAPPPPAEAVAAIRFGDRFFDSPFWEELLNRDRLERPVRSLQLTATITPKGVLFECRAKLSGEAALAWSRDLAAKWDPQKLQGASALVLSSKIAFEGDELWLKMEASDADLNGLIPAPKETIRQMNGVEEFFKAFSRR